LKEATMSLSFAELLLQNKDYMIKELARQLKEGGGATYASVSLEQLHKRMGLVFDALQRAIAQDDVGIMEEFVTTSVRQRVQERYAMEEIQTFVSILHEIVLEVLETAYDEEPTLYRASLRQFEKLAHRTRQKAFDVYLHVFEEQMEAQQRTLAELSTPVIKVYENVLVLPLVGAIDTERSHRIMEDLLVGITQHQAEMVIIDITGVPLVDTAVANHLLQTIKAARLLGTRSILVGIRGEVAQALVHLQVDLVGVVTRSNLQAGIEYALEQLGLEIAPRDESLSAEAAEASAGA
jgi:rsbT co-antagonist protein RsbR